VALLATAGIVLPGLGDGEPAPAPSSPPASSTADAPSGESSASGLEDSEIAGISTVLAAIDSGTPLPYSEDGQTFQNREALLPAQPIGYYSEYTVETPGSSDRGARRLIIGDGGETYYTDDHYLSFTRIDPEDFSQ
jgi:ribonuclease T1